MSNQNEGARLLFDDLEPTPRALLIYPPFDDAHWARVRAFICRCNREDLRMRFGGASDFEDPSTLKRFFGVEPGLGEIAWLDDTKVGGIGAMLHRVHVSTSEAEIGLIVRTDLKRRGLGTTLLMDAITRSARSGLATLSGYVLRENTPMIKLARKLGFTTRASVAFGMEIAYRLPRVRPAI